MYKTQPWTLEEKESDLKLLKKSPSFLKEDKAVSTARVISLFEQNKNKVFTNRSIATQLGLSEETVSCITNRLEATSMIKITKVLQRYSAYSLQYQHKEGPLQSVSKARGVDGNKKDAVQVVQELFEKDTSAILSKKEITLALDGKASEGHVGESLRILLIMGIIKIIDNFEGRTPKFQHTSGNQKGLTVLIDNDENYKSLKEFFKDKVYSEQERKEFKNQLPKECKLYYSSAGLTPVYHLSDLEKCASRIEKKGILGGIFN